MGLIARSEKSAHWYDLDGECKHTIVGKNGKERATTVRDAREKGWVPSVTTILSVIANPSLQAWKDEQLILASLTLPKLQNETLESFAYRVIEDSQKHSLEARNKGSDIHLAIENYVHSKTKIADEYNYIYEELDELNLSGSIEKRFVSKQNGFAGTMDFVGTIFTDSDNEEFTIIDFKTQGTKEGKYKIYDGWKYQLCAYLIGAKENNLTRQNTSLYNIVVSTSEQKIWLYKYTEEDIEISTQIFNAAKTIFYLTKGLKPTW